MIDFYISNFDNNELSVKIMRIYKLLIDEIKNKRGKLSNRQIKFTLN